MSGAWSRALSPSTGWCPRPRPHQSLLQFLSGEVNIAHVCIYEVILSESVAGGRGGGRAELDRENAHFVLSETVISTLEQVRSLEISFWQRYHCFGSFQVLYVS